MNTKYTNPLRRKTSIACAFKVRNSSFLHQSQLLVTRQFQNLDADERG